MYISSRPLLHIAHACPASVHPQDYRRKRYYVTAIDAHRNLYLSSMAHWRHELTRLWHGISGRAARLTTPSQRPRGPRDPRQGHASRQGHSRTAHTTLTPPRCPQAPPPATLPPCHTHASPSNRPSPARSASMNACGSAPNSRNCFNTAERSCICCVAAMRHISYGKNGKDKLSSATPPRRTKFSSDTREPQNKAPKPHPEARKTQGIRGDRRGRGETTAGSRGASGRSEQHGGNWWAAQDSNL